MKYLILALMLSGCSSPCAGIHKMKAWSNYAVDHAESQRYRDYMKGRADAQQDIIDIYCH